MPHQPDLQPPLSSPAAPWPVLSASRVTSLRFPPPPPGSAFHTLLPPVLRPPSTVHRPPSTVQCPRPTIHRPLLISTAYLPKVSRGHWRPRPTCPPSSVLRPPSSVTSPPSVHALYSPLPTFRPHPPVSSLLTPPSSLPPPAGRSSSVRHCV